jgi:hypothetical protein
MSLQAMLPIFSVISIFIISEVLITKVIKSIVMKYYSLTYNISRRNITLIFLITVIRKVIHN